MLRIYNAFYIINLRLNKRRICQGFNFSSGYSRSGLVIPATIITQMVDRHEMLYQGTTTGDVELDPFICCSRTNGV